MLNAALKCLNCLKWAMPLAALLGTASTAFAATTVNTATSVVIPSYFNATSSVSNWNSLTATARKVPTTAILNPNSGPGIKEDVAYAAAVTRLHAAGGKVIGYVSTSYAKRSLSAVVADINAYVTLYKVDGFFHRRDDGR